MSFWQTFLFELNLQFNNLLQVHKMLLVNVERRLQSSKNTFNFDYKDVKYFLNSTCNSQ